jgi:hypothetical protein
VAGERTLGFRRSHQQAVVTRRKVTTVIRGGVMFDPREIERVIGVTVQ